MEGSAGVGGGAAGDSTGVEPDDGMIVDDGAHFVSFA